MILPIALFTFALLLIRVQPYDDHELRQLLLSDGCAAPCFMGIRPGVTTQEEAIQLLVASNRLEIEPSNLNSDNTASPILFQWNGKQSHLIDGIAPLTLTFQNTKPKTVAQITFQLQSTITLGDLYLILGKPSRYSWPTLMAPNMGSAQFIMIAYQQYDDDLINLLTISQCPLSLSQMLREPVAGIEYEPALRTNFPTSTLKEILRYPNCG